jgi:hypothetical protein
MQVTVYDEVFHKVKAILELDGSGGYTIIQADGRTRARLFDPPLILLDSVSQSDGQPEEEFWRPPMDDFETILTLRMKFKYGGERVISEMDDQILIKENRRLIGKWA